MAQTSSDSHHGSPEEQDELVPIRETAEMLGVSFPTLRRWDRTGHLRAVRLAPGSPRRYRRSEIEALKARA